MCLKKLLSLCQRNGILRVEPSGKGASLHYGPLGSLLKRNIFNEWLSSLLSCREFQVFPLEVQHPREERFLQGPEEDLPAVLDSWLDYDELFRPQPPFGYAVYGPCVNARPEKVAASNLTDFGFLSGLRVWTRLSLVFRCPPAQQPTHWFYFWSKQRHIWWRKFSSIPSQFSLSGITSAGGSQQWLCVQLDSRLPLEAVSLWDGGERGHFVTCQVELEAAVLAHLANSYSADKWREGEGREVLQLHSRLAPYQACLWAEGGDDKLQAAAAHLAQQLKARGVSVFPALDLPFSKFDEMGIPYTIVLAKSSLANGIAGLRSRDTTLQEEVHISELTQKLIQYLKI